jgi:hypothetical protein
MQMGRNQRFNFLIFFLGDKRQLQIKQQKVREDFPDFLLLPISGREVLQASRKK